MRRLGILLVLLVTAVTSSPASALAFADHGCCTPAPGAHAQKETQANGKHAHCAGMAMRNAESSPAAHKVAAVHSCKACGLSALMSPRSAMAAAAWWQTNHSTHAIAAAPVAASLDSRTMDTRDVRGPPSFLI